MQFPEIFLLPYFNTAVISKLSSTVILHSLPEQHAGVITYCINNNGEGRGHLYHPSHTFLSRQEGLDINLFWDLSCRTSKGNFHLSEMKIHLPKLFCLVLIGRILCSCNCFGIKGGLLLLVLSDKWGEKFCCILLVVQDSRTILNVHPWGKDYVAWAVGQLPFVLL